MGLCVCTLLWLPTLPPTPAVAKTMAESSNIYKDLYYCKELLTVCMCNIGVSLLRCSECLLLISREGQAILTGNIHKTDIK